MGVIAGLAACAQLEIGAHAVKGSAAANDPGAERLAPVQVATDAEGYALWSGFRTTDGVWVAHPRLPAPSRAYVRNSLNGRVIEAKVLRRDPSTPGPMILLSAEAARDLEIGPHRLTKVQIEVIEDALPDASVAEAPTAEVPEPAPTAEVSETALAPVESSPEPLAAIVEAPETAAPAPNLEPGAQALATLPMQQPAAPDLQNPAEVQAGGETAAPPQVLAEIPAEPAAVASQAAPAAPAQPAVATQSAGVFRGDAPYELGGAAGGGDLAMAAPAAPAAPQPKANAAPEPTSAPATASQPSAPAPVTTAVAAPETAPTPSPPADSDVGQSFVQVVSFTAESSAAELATRLNALGNPTLTDSGSAGDSRWHRVLIGPLSGAADEQRALEAARSLGYNDAFVTRRGATTGEPKAEPTAAVAPAAPSPVKPAAAATPAPASETSPYVQVGSFTVQDNADAVVARLKDLGLPSFSTSGKAGDSRWHRVLIGPLDGSDQTARALDAAKSLGHSDAFVTRF